MAKKKTAPAEQEPTPQETIYTGHIKPFRRGNVTAPNLFITDTPPASGDQIKFKINGRTYKGIVDQTTEANGETAISFKGGFATK